MCGEGRGSWRGKGPSDLVATVGTAVPKPGRSTPSASPADRGLTGRGTLSTRLLLPSSREHPLRVMGAYRATETFGMRYEESGRCFWWLQRVSRSRTPPSSGWCWQAFWPLLLGHSEETRVRTRLRGNGCWPRSSLGGLRTTASSRRTRRTPPFGRGRQRLLLKFRTSRCRV